MEFLVVISGNRISAISKTMQRKVSDASILVPKTDMA